MHSSGLAVLGLCLLACLFVQAARDLYGRRGHGRQSQVCVCVLIDTILLHNKSHSKMNLQAITTRLCARCLCYGCGLAGCVCTVPMVGYGLSSISSTIPRAYMHDDDDHSDGFMANHPTIHHRIQATSRQQTYHKLASLILHDACNIMVAIMHNVLNCMVLVAGRVGLSALLRFQSGQ